MHHELIIKHRINKSIFTDHFFLEYPDRNVEIHFGRYSLGEIKEIGTTANAHTRGVIYACDDCLNRIIHKIRLGKKNWFFPFVNCESIANNVSYNIPISFQTVFIFNICLLTILSLFNQFMIVLLLIVIILYFIYLRYLYSCKFKRICSHLEYVEDD